MEQTSSPVNATDVAGVLTAMAELMTGFRQQDLALQDALSGVAARARSSHEMNNLQHIDLLTQTHNDLASLLPILAQALDGTPIQKAELREALTLRSLQDILVSDGQKTECRVVPGDLSLF